MRRLETRLDGLVLLEPAVHGDERGFFVETYRRETFAEHGIDVDFVQHNHSRSGRGVLRGMHFQPGLAKHVRCPRGAILDVAVDVRRGSPTFGEWEAFELDDVGGRQLFVPAGFAHGFVVLSEIADVVYLQNDYYDPDRQLGLRFDDPEVGIAWPEGIEILANDRDRSAPLLSELGVEDLPSWRRPRD
jgi:dTDP-4-dehydrorhamnose 3,5-epimerase